MLFVHQTHCYTVYVGGNGNLQWIGRAYKLSINSWHCVNWMQTAQLWRSYLWLTAVRKTEKNPTYATCLLHAAVQASSLMNRTSFAAGPRRLPYECGLKQPLYYFRALTVIITNASNYQTEYAVFASSLCTWLDARSSQSEGRPIIACKAGKVLASVRWSAPLTL